MQKRKLVAFDLDGTLTLSKQSLSLEMGYHLKQLSELANIAIVSGASEQQFFKQVIPILGLVAFPMQRLFLITTNGGKILHHLGEKWDTLYPSYMMSGGDEQEICLWFEDVLDDFDWYNELEIDLDKQLEFRGPQVTFSALGQDAPLTLKEVFDPELTKRIPLRNRLAEKLPQYDVKIGGTTSIDVVLKGVSKVSGLHQVMNLLSLTQDEVVYVGDALYEGGNDRCVKDAGFRCAEVIHPRETREFINRLIYPFLYPRPSDADEYIWMVRIGDCEEHIFKYPGGTKAKICLGCGLANPSWSDTDG